VVLILSCVCRHDAGFGMRFHTGARAGNTVVFAGGFHTDKTTGQSMITFDFGSFIVVYKR
jgi:hypothetical protein